jgi:hypothetical protein
MQTWQIKSFEIILKQKTDLKKTRLQNSIIAERKCEDSNLKTIDVHSKSSDVFNVFLESRF